MSESTEGPKDDRKARWKTDENGNLLSYPLTGFELAQLVGSERCGLRLEFATAEDQRRALQLSIEPSEALRLGNTLGILADHMRGADPRPKALKGSIDDITQPAPYPRVGRCIYCGATRYSEERERLGDEHIVPLALGGEDILPQAACGKCEGKLNSYEQFCHKLTFGTLRYHLGLPTRRPKERPKTLPLECTINGERVTRDVPLDNVPVSLLLPIFDLPDILLDKDPTERNIYTERFVMRQLPPVSLKWGNENDISSISSPSAGVQGIKFASLIAKIGHAYATAVCINNPEFQPMLADLVRKETGPHPLPYLVGGETEILPPTPSLHEVGLLRRRTRKHTLIVVRVRLFAFLATPTYYAIAGACPIR
ncbi:HNH endonuclease [Bradyrhizobium sp. AUGA SZCCT0160]|uniref:HNH endonuclease n=1 Tax=Bradyrhizobium sp. AUGA SZCCT0160 TaxID=2807662 RepID=UPI001BAD2B7A|nr:HNH endonuclease [Bradyrhizobium sp. AUGA SZCCT0160]MBR1189214.1 hypothetical protein [Bradyrhizobium sp. AUGA SZCCT0160]